MNLKSIKSRLFKFSLLTGLCCFLILLGITYSGNIQLVFLYKTKNVTDCQIFWRVGNQEFDQKQSVSIRTKSETYQTIRVNLPQNIHAIQSLKINTGSVQTSWEIDYMLIKKRGFKPVTLALENLKPSKDIPSFNLQHILRFLSRGNDPSLTIDLPVISWHIDWLLMITYIFLSLLVGSVVYYSSHFIIFRKCTLMTLFLVISLSLVTGLSFVMVMKAGFSASPDERDHFMAAEYYKSHSLTPQKYSGEGVYTYNSTWNYSRVYEPCIEYYLAGKFSNLFDNFLVSFRSVRLSGVLLLVFFIIIALRFPDKNSFLMPLLITPQIWYIFSYVNDDYFPLFISILLLILTEEWKSDLLKGIFNTKTCLGLIILGGILGILIMEKRNYLIFVLFYLFYIFSLPILFSGDYKYDIKAFFWALKKYIKIPVLIILVALAIVVAKKFTLSETKGNVSKEVAAYYEQSHLKSESFRANDFSGKHKFVSYYKMIKPWFKKSYKSFNGVYGYMKYYGSWWYYQLISFLQIILFLTLLLTLYFRKNPELYWWFFVFLVMLLITLFASSYLWSYQNSYQPQGRYLFPILPVLGLLFYKIDIVYFKKYIFPIVIVMFFVSLYSFVFVGYGSLCF
jgi:hypothetical protein